MKCKCFQCRRLFTINRRNKKIICPHCKEHMESPMDRILLEGKERQMALKMQTIIERMDDKYSGECYPFFHLSHIGIDINFALEMVRENGRGELHSILDVIKSIEVLEKTINDFRKYFDDFDVRAAKIHQIYQENFTLCRKCQGKKYIHKLDNGLEGECENCGGKGVILRKVKK